MPPTYQELAPRDPTSKTGRVWQIAEDITHRKGRRATRGEVIDAYVSEGGNADTASTQYWHWKQAYSADAAQRQESQEAASRSLPSVSSTQLTIGADGRVVIPAEMRAAMQIGPDGKVTARVVDGELRVISPRAAVLRAQTLVRDVVPEGVSLADELIAERRAEARREEKA
jgi:bifunctional DNA-binding transcriptional regulator/antitoxin component of YhaV-PrlF toxin-antitoxin module